MASTNVELNGGAHDHVLRPRPRKPQHSQVSELARQSSNTSINGMLETPHAELASTVTR